MTKLNSVGLLHYTKKKKGGRGGGGGGRMENQYQGKRKNGGFREKVFDFSLDLRQIRSSAVFGTRRRTALREEGFAWVPDL